MVNNIVDKTEYEISVHLTEITCLIAYYDLWMDCTGHVQYIRRSVFLVTDGK